MFSAQLLPGVPRVESDSYMFQARPSSESRAEDCNTSISIYSALHAMSINPFEIAFLERRKITDL
jgi:hypothetical protein